MNRCVNCARWMSTGDLWCEHCRSAHGLPHGTTPTRRDERRARRARAWKAITDTISDIVRPIR